jgi:glyoxylase-like metal-dependent hydrolase (beta-lactamase superfamily II)
MLAAAALHPWRPAGGPRLLARAGLLLAAGLLSACAVLSAASPDRAEQVAPGVYLVRGADGPLSPDNRGRVGNTGFIVGPQGVLAIDSGTSYRHGQQLLQTIARVTDKPVRALVITHTRQEFLFGATAFRERGIPIYMQQRAARLMAARCERCLRTLKEQLGEDEMQGSAVIRVDHEFLNTQPLGVAGRAVRLLHYGHSSGPGDVAVFDETSGVLFAGGLLDQGHIPDVQDSDLPGWTAALAELRRLPISRIVPGHGPAAGPELIAKVGSYLTQLQAGAASLLRAGTSLRDVPEELQLPEFKDWQHYDNTHRRNAAVVFLRLEQAQLAQ